MIKKPKDFYYTKVIGDYLEEVYASIEGPPEDEFISIRGVFEVSEEGAKRLHTWLGKALLYLKDSNK